MNHQIMEQYRKSDQYYIDEYDRTTIEELKKIEKLMEKAEKRFFIDEDDPKSPETNTDYIGYRMRYLDTGVEYSRNKESSIRAAIQSDERKDRLIRFHAIPANILCDTCGEDMKFELHDFLQRDSDLIFIFSCPNGHLPKKAVYPNGREYFLPKHTCKYCGSDLVSKKKKTKKKLTLTDTCKVCGKVEVLELDISPRKILPVDEEERKKYCTDFKGRNNFMEDLKRIAELGKFTEVDDNKKKYEFDKVKKLNLPQLEQTLTAQIEKSGFIKLQFDKPKTSRYLTMEFSAQDPTDREPEKSIKALKRTIDTTLFHTNWRLMSPGIDYKLGFLSGQLKGFSLDEDILKIAQEIWEKENK